MAEAIGVIASILQLVDAVATAGTMLKDLCDASEQQGQLLFEINSLQPLLSALQERLVSNSASIASLSINDALFAFEDTMRRCSMKLQAGGVFSQVTKPISWALWDKKEAKADLEKVERFKSLLNTWLTMDIWDLAQQHDNILTSLELSAREQRQHINDTERTAILEWMSPVNSFERQADVFSTWQPGTGRWFLASPEFREWENAAGTTLWCHGMPGAGKTVLASLVVNHLEHRAQEENIGVACMYLNHKEIETHTPRNLLGCLWRQLVWGKPIPATARAVFRHHQERSTKITLDEIQTILLSSLAPYSKVYFVVDALDEYPEAQRANLLRYLRSTTKNGSVNIMITSRPHIGPDSTIFPRLQSLELRATEEDMRHYINIQISTSNKLSKHVSARPELHNEIESKILDNVHGMFLLAKLHIDSLTGKNTIKAVRQALHHLPKNLRHTYDEAMERIDHQAEDDRELAYLTLTWVANAKRPLSVRELLEALAIEPNTTSLDPDNMLDMSILLSVCAGLVTVDETASVVRLIHYTAQDYLDSIQSQRFPEAQMEITSRFLTYFGFEEFSTLPQKKVEQDELILEHPLLGYGQYWLSHAVGQPEQQLLDQIEHFLAQVSEWREFWRAQWGHQSLPQEVAWLTGKPVSIITFLLWAMAGSRFDEPLWPMSPLCIAAAGNLQTIAKDLLQRGLPSDIGDALQTACYCGHMPMVGLLLSHGADPNLSGEYCEEYLGTALQAAAFQGHDAVVQRLLDHGAEINACRGRFGTALQAAAHEGHEAVVRFLLDRGADVNTLGGSFETALQAAAAEGRMAIVELLILRGADVNILGGSGGSALQAASFSGHEAVVELLIQRGAFVNASEAGRYGTSLQAAACKGQEAVVRVLLEHGADVNAHAGYHGTSLQAAAHSGNDAVVQLLLQHSAEVNAQGGHYGTALGAALVSNEGDSVARLLIEHSADVNIVGGQFGTALQAAAAWKNQPMVELLLERGADPRILGGDHGSALHAAAYGGEEAMVELLLDRGADVNALGGEYGTALQAAAYEGKEDIVELLLRNGADANAQGGKYGTALQAAALQGTVKVIQGTTLQAGQSVISYDRQSVVRSLIQHGADVNITGGLYGAALQAAAYNGNEAVVKLLIESGAKVNADGGEYGSALQAARARNHDSVVEILLEHGAI
ncbi:ankyrin repeat-containing domain protein [Mycena vulgaris]|nr:ankyrin repeat-containing domain protein [Mycena vulgaris]